MDATLPPIQISSFVSFTLAIVLLFVGKVALNRYEVLRRYSIPEPVIGGFVAALVVAFIYFLFERQVLFKLEVQDYLLLYFFAGIGLKSDIRVLLSGGKPLAVLILLASVFIFIQNLLGMGMAGLFGMDPVTGLMTGSVSLTGGAGTTMAWAPIFVEQLGITQARELGIAANTIGLIAACMIGGPIANYLIHRHRLQTNSGADLDVGVSNATPHESVDSYGVLWAWLWLNLTLMVGHGINYVLEAQGVKLPLFVSCLMAGILIGNLGSRFAPKLRWNGQEKGLALISDIALGMFLVMALMGLKVWELQGSLVFLAVVMPLQILLSVLFTLFVVFRFSGKDYEASVISAGFGGITLGSTATAIVNMTAVAKQYGAAHRAFLLVPLVCGFFIDIINAFAINFFINL